MGKLIDDEPMGNETLKALLIVAIIIFSITMLMVLIIPPQKERGKYIDDREAGVVWIINEEGDTIGTVQ